MKILSMYLPQYHRVKENDEWWGEGYTDWVSAKNAVPLYEGHYQPHIPENQYYYDLTDRQALEWQADLMKKYGVDGQCIYHYWFKDGRKILEKPAENLLEWKDIDMPFCFCWANQSWANSWSAVNNAAVWCDARENKKKNESDNGLLLEQQYGDEKEWRKHFDYLLMFFKDKRYLKMNNKPVFVLYQAMYIPVLEEMSECWNCWAREEGFDGIYFVGVSNRDESLVDAVLYPGPQTAMGKMMQELGESKLKTLDYKAVWERMIVKAYMEKDCMVGAFVGYDDTPRRGEKGLVIDNATPELFEEYFTKLLAINALHNQPFTFINAWNEWGEGMHLEPDEKNGRAYLEAVYDSKNHYGEYLQAVRQIDKIYEEPREKVLAYKRKARGYEKRIDQYGSYWRLMDKWLSLKEENRSLADILEKKHIYKVAIYGVGMLGKHLINDLLDSNIEIVCAMDKKVIDKKYDFPVIQIVEKIPDGIPESDVVIITPVYEFSNIKKLFEKKKMENVISLEALFE